MLVLIAVHSIPWYMVVVAMIIPAILSWLLANEFAKDRNKDLEKKIQHLQEELKQSYQHKQIIPTKKVSPEVKFSDVKTSSSTAVSYEKNESSFRKINIETPKIKTAKPDIAPNQVEVKTSKPSKASISQNIYPKLKDDLEIVEGIGSKMKDILRENHIMTWGNLASTSPKALKEILRKYGDRFRIIDPSHWPDQAGLAKAGHWGKLIALQEKDGGKGSAKVSKLLVRYGYIKQYKKDDLKAIDGIGPKTAELLNSEGITTWEQLAKAEVEQLQNILNKGGKKFGLINPETWPIQAKSVSN